MGWLDRFQGQTVALDAAPLIYYIEEHPAFLAPLDDFFDALFAGEFTAVTSALTLTEVLVLPYRLGRADLANRYRAILTSSAQVRTIPVTMEIAEAASRLRATHRIRTPDAVHLATAVVARAGFFLTNDRQLASVSPPEVLILEDAAKPY